MADIDIETDEAFNQLLKDTGVEVEETTTAPVEEKKDETNTQAQTDGGTEQAKPEDKAGEGQEAPKSDSSSGNADGGKQQGTQAQGQGTDSTEGDDVVLEKLRRGETIHPNVMQRWYNQRENARRENTRLMNESAAKDTELNTLRQRVQTYETASQQIGSTDPQTTQAALRLYQDMNVNPVQTLTKIVAELKAAGHNVDNIAPGVDTAAITRIIDERLGKTAQGGNGEVDVDAEVNAFFTKYPDARIHDEVLGNIISQFPQLTPEQAYHQLKRQADEKGFDFSKPLAPQVALRNASLQAANGQQQQQKQDDPPPLVNGRGAATAVTDRDPLDDSNSGTNETYSDIIKKSMEEAGFKVN